MTRKDVWSKKLRTLVWTKSSDGVTCTISTINESRHRIKNNNAVRLSYWPDHGSNSSNRNNQKSCHQVRYVVIRGRPLVRVLSMS